MDNGIYLEVWGGSTGRFNQLVSSSKLQVGKLYFVSSRTDTVKGLFSTDTSGSTFVATSSNTYMNVSGTAVGYATETFVIEKINEAQLSGGDVDLSIYYTKTQVDSLLSPKADTDDLAAVAFSGSYNDLTDKPTIPSLTNYATKTYVTNAISVKANTSDLANVAFSGSYNDLSNKPTIPSITGLASTTYVDGKSRHAVEKSSSDDLDSMTASNYNEVWVWRSASIPAHSPSIKIIGGSAWVEYQLANTGYLVQFCLIEGNLGLYKRAQYYDGGKVWSAWTRLDNTVHLTDDESIDGLKTFYTVPKTSGTPVISSSSIDLATPKSLWTYLNKTSSVTSSKDCDDFKDLHTEYRWISSSIPANVPVASKAGSIRVFSGSNATGDRSQLAFIEDGSVWFRFFKSTGATFTTWTRLDNGGLSTVATTGSYNDLTDKPTISESVQADWNESSSTAASYIKNKPNLSLKENTSNKVTSISSSSTDTQYPSAKLLFTSLSSKADDSSVVHKAGAETITGLKTFTGNIYRKRDLESGDTYSARVNVLNDGSAGFSCCDTTSSESTCSAMYCKTDGSFSFENNSAIFAALKQTPVISSTSKDLIRGQELYARTFKHQTVGSTDNANSFTDVFTWYVWTGSSVPSNVPLTSSEGSIWVAQKATGSNFLVQFASAFNSTESGLYYRYQRTESSNTVWTSWELLNHTVHIDGQETINGYKLFKSGLQIGSSENTFSGLTFIRSSKKAVIGISDESELTLGSYASNGTTQSTRLLLNGTSFGASFINSSSNSVARVVASPSVSSSSVDIIRGKDLYTALSSISYNSLTDLPSLDFLPTTGSCIHTGDISFYDTSKTNWIYNPVVLSASASDEDLPASETSTAWIPNSNAVIRRINSAVSGLDSSSLVHIAGAETITGYKKFSGGLEVGDNTADSWKSITFVRNGHKAALGLSGEYELSFSVYNAAGTKQPSRVVLNSSSFGVSFLDDTGASVAKVSTSPTIASYSTDIIRGKDLYSVTSSLAASADVVHKTGDLSETVTGIKMFSSPIYVTPSNVQNNPSAYLGWTTAGEIKLNATFSTTSDTTYMLMDKNGKFSFYKKSGNIANIKETTSVTSTSNDLIKAKDLLDNCYTKTECDNKFALAQDVGIQRLYAGYTFYDRSDLNFNHYARTIMYLSGSVGGACWFNSVNADIGTELIVVNTMMGTGQTISFNPNDITGTSSVAIQPGEVVYFIRYTRADTLEQWWFHSKQS